MVSTIEFETLYPEAGEAGKVAVISEEIADRGSRLSLYGIGRAWKLEVYFSDILVYESSYVGDEAGLERARSDAADILAERVPSYLYPISGSELTFEDIRFDRKSRVFERRA